MQVMSYSRLTYWSQLLQCSMIIYLIDKFIGLYSDDLEMWDQILLKPTVTV